jgi:hypothetical protein
MIVLPRQARDKHRETTQTEEMRLLTGNVLDGDGCDAHCQLEPLPAGHARILSEWRQRWMPREDIHAEILSLEVLAGKKTRLFAMPFVY